MKDATYALRKAYFDLITANTDLTVYENQADDEAIGNYVIIGGETSQDGGTKDSFEGEYTIQIDVVTRFQNTAGSGKVADDIVSEIKQALFPTPTTCAITMTDFAVMTWETETKKLQLQTPNESIIRRIITATHQVYEK